MDDSLTNLVNDSQVENSTFKLEINMSDDDRINLSRILFLVSFILNICILFTSNVVINVFCFIFSLFIVGGGIALIYKNNDYINNNLIMSSMYILSLIFELFLIINNNTSFIGLTLSIVYQSIYIVNYE